MSFHPRAVCLIYSTSLDNFIYCVLVHKSCVCALLTLLPTIYDDPTIKPYYLWEFSFPVPRGSFIETQTYGHWVLTEVLVLLGLPQLSQRCRRCWHLETKSFYFFFAHFYGHLFTFPLGGASKYSAHGLTVLIEVICKISQ